jgi:hypothetical protein
MNVLVRPSACPHDCPSTCALEVEILDAHTIGRVRGAKDNDYTAGVICAKRLALCRRRLPRQQGVGAQGARSGLAPRAAFVEIGPRPGHFFEK